MKRPIATHLAILAFGIVGTLAVPSNGEAGFFPWGGGCCGSSYSAGYFPGYYGGGYYGGLYGVGYGAGYGAGYYGGYYPLAFATTYYGSDCCGGCASPCCSLGCGLVRRLLRGFSGMFRLLWLRAVMLWQRAALFQRLWHVRVRTGLQHANAKWAGG